MFNLVYELVYIFISIWSMIWYMIGVCLTYKSNEKMTMAENFWSGFSYSGMCVLPKNGDMAIVRLLLLYNRRVQYQMLQEITIFDRFMRGISFGTYIKWPIFCYYEGEDVHCDASNTIHIFLCQNFYFGIRDEFSFEILYFSSYHLL